MEFNNTNHTLQVGEEITVPSDETHVVYTVSESPSCWMYIFMNTTEWNNETIRNWILHPGKPLLYFKFASRDRGQRLCEQKYVNE